MRWALFRTGQGLSPHGGGAIEWPIVPKRCTMAVLYGPDCAPFLFSAKVLSFFRADYIARRQFPLPRYILKRVLQLIPILFVVSILIFALVRLSPADPIASITKGKQIS